jgi:ABC-type uncharacterized transport system permease subunit
MTASSAARARTILRVTVPRPAEFSASAPSLSGFVFTDKKSSRVKGLVVMRSFHLARAAILAQVAGFGKNVVPLFGFWIGHGFLLIGPHLMEGLRKNWSLQFGCMFGGVIFHKLIFLVD